MDAEFHKVLLNIRSAATDDLLNRVTVERAGMQPDAIVWMEEELRSRGITPAQVFEYERQFEGCLRNEDGSWVICDFCRRPAALRCWGWYRLWRRLPIFPRVVCYCREHAPK
jgi:hypothetical protein